MEILQGFLRRGNHTNTKALARQPWAGGACQSLLGHRHCWDTRWGCSGKCGPIKALFGCAAFEVRDFGDVKRLSPVQQHLGSWSKVGAVPASPQASDTWGDVCQCHLLGLSQNQNGSQWFTSLLLFWCLSVGTLVALVCQHDWQIYPSGSLHPYFCWSFFSFHPKFSPSGGGQPPARQHPPFCTALSGFSGHWRKPQVPVVVSQASSLKDFQFPWVLPSSGGQGTAKYNTAMLNIAGATSSNILV